MSRALPGSPPPHPPYQRAAAKPRATCFIFFGRQGGTAQTMTSSTEEVTRLRRLFASGELVHPFLDARYFSDIDVDVGDTSIGRSQHASNFADLSAALALCCGAEIPTASAEAKNLAKDIAGEEMDCRHIVLILCDGMGNSVIDEHCSSDREASFLQRKNNPTRLRAVFPSTTPAALTTLATASWPWNARLGSEGQKWVRLSGFSH